MAEALYIHIPFCRNKCVYCDFYSIEYKREVAASYIDVLCRQISELKGRIMDTVYIGGGTPSILSLNLWKKLINALNKALGPVAEFTVEANPESLDAEKVKLLRAGGVNRISLGVQSFNNGKLAKLGRIHSAGESIDKIFMLKKQGFKNVSIDLIFGVWQERLDDWKKELEQAASLPIQHISLYSLICEKKTPLFKKVKQAMVELLSEEITARMYKYNLSYLSSKGFNRYEVSNFSKRGYQCLHNLNYWNNNSYFGLGPSSVSFLDGLRQKNTPLVGDYINRVSKGVSPVVYSEKLTLINRAKETAALKIRTAEGIKFKWFKEHTGFDFLKLESKALKEAINEKLVKYTRSNGKCLGVCLTQRGFLFADTVCSGFL